MNGVSSVLFNPNGAPSPASLPDGVAALDFIDGQPTLVSNTGKQQRVGPKLDQYLSSARVSDIETSVADNIRGAFRTYLHSLNDYTIECLTPGSHVLRSSIALGKPAFFVISNKSKGPTYFDFCCYSYDQRQDLCQVTDYSVSRKHNLQGLLHSGDIQENGHLLHTLSVTSSNVEHEQLYLSAVGYKKTAICNFIVQQPSVCVADHDAQVIYIIPCPLDTSTVQNSCLVHLAHVSMVRGEVTVTVLPKPAIQSRGDNHVNTGDVCDTVKRSLNSAAELFRTAQHSSLASSSGSISTSVSTSAAGFDRPPVQVDSIALMLEQGTNVPPALGWLNGFITFYRAYGRWDEPVNDSDHKLLLPIAFGEVCGGMIGAVGQQSLHQVIFKESTCGAILVVSDQMTDIAARAVQRTANNCLVVVVPKTDVALEDLNINATCMAGPLSIVIVAQGDRLLWYRGCAMGSLASGKNFSFADDVTDYFTHERISRWMAERAYPAYAIEHLDQQSVFFQGASMTPNEAKDALLAAPFDMWTNPAYTADVNCVLTQLQGALTAAQLDGLSKELLIALEAKKNSILAETSTKLKQELTVAILGDGVDGEQLRTLTYKLRTLKRSLNNSLGNVVSQLSSLSSRRGVSNKKQSLAREARKATIAGNVDAVNNMSADAKAEFFEQFERLYMLTLDQASLPLYLARIEEAGGFSQWMMTAPTGHAISAFPFNERCTELDGDDVSAMIEVCRELSVEHVADSDAALALPIRQSGDSMVPVPIPAEEHLRSGDQHWAELANKTPWSTYRIMLRGALADCVSGRQFSLASSSKELGFFIIWLFLHSAGCVVDRMSSIPDNAESTTVVYVRALTAWALSTMASTTATLTPLYKMWAVNPSSIVPRTEHWWLIPMLQKVAPYTLWDTAQFNENIVKLAVTHMHSTVVAPALTAVNVAAKTETSVKTDIWMQFTRLVVTYVWHCATHGIRVNSGRIVELMKRMKCEPSEGTKRMLNDHPLAVHTAVCTYIKWSGNIDNAQKGTWKQRCIDVPQKDADALDKLVAIVGQFGGIKSNWASVPGPESFDEDLRFLLGVDDTFLPRANVEAAVDVDKQRDELKKRPGAEKALLVYDNLEKGVYVPGYGGLNTQLSNVLQHLGVTDVNSAVTACIRSMLVCKDTNMTVVYSCGMAALKRYTPATVVALEA